MEHVVIDEGSGQLKMAWKDKETGKPETFTIPSRVVDGAGMKGGGGWHNAAYDVDGLRYTVAPRMDGAIRTNIEEYQVSDYNRVLVNEGLRLAGFGGKDVCIYVTLPIKDFFNQHSPDGLNRELIRQKCDNLKQPVKSMSAQVLANIIDCKVNPEAIPAWNNYIMDDEGNIVREVNEQHKIMVVDIGGTTTDMTIIDGFGNMQKYDSLRCGVFNIADNLESDLMDRFKRKRLEKHHLDDALKEGTFAEENISDLISKACKPVVNKIYREMKQFSPDPKSVDFVFYVGGGAALMADSLSSQYGGEKEIGGDLDIALGILKQKMNAGAF